MNRLTHLGGGLLNTLPTFIILIWLKGKHDLVLISVILLFFLALLTKQTWSIVNDII